MVKLDIVCDRLKQYNNIICYINIKHNRIGIMIIFYHNIIKLT